MLLTLILIVIACAVAYKYRVTLIARVLGQSETRVQRQLKRKGH